MRERIFSTLRFIGALTFSVLAWMTQVEPNDVIPKLAKWWLWAFDTQPNLSTLPYITKYGFIIFSTLAVEFSIWFLWPLLAKLKSKNKTAAQILYPKPTLLSKCRNKLAKIFPRLEKKYTGPVQPRVALDNFTDPAMLARRSKAINEVWQIDAQIAILDHQLSRFQRRLMRGVGEASLAAARGPSEEEANLIERKEELIDKRNWADIENDAARNDVTHDFYTKLLTGKLIAHGFSVPHEPGKPSVDIPQLEWDFLRFDDEWIEAIGQGISYHVSNVRVA